jgi:type VI secretion system secreted protein Hcp
MAFDAYLKLDGIQGEATDANHTNEIQLLSFSFGGTQTSSIGSHSGGSGAGKVELANFSITKYVDKASTPLFKSLVTGGHIATGVFSGVKSGADGKPYLKLSFEELFVTSIHVSATSEIPTESVSFSYKTIKYEYSTQDAKGNQQATGSGKYDLAKNQYS